MEKLEKTTRKWWFFIIVLVLQFILVPFSTKNFSFNKIGDIIAFSFTHSIELSMGAYYVYFQVVSIIILLLLFIFKNKVAGLFTFYVFLSYLTFSFIPNISISEQYGVIVVPVNIVMILFIAWVWFKELLESKNNYSFSNLKWSNSWLILLSLFAYWLPIDFGPTYAKFDFKLSYFLFSGSSLAFCMMTPVLLTVLSLNIPKINIVTYRITALVGLIIGFYNMFKFQDPNRVDEAIMHLPLVIVSIYSLFMSYRIKKYHS